MNSWGENLAPDLPILEEAMRKAIQSAGEFTGATSPNPPVGAVVLSPAGEVLSIAAHEKVGQAHAEVRAIQLCKEAGHWEQRHTLVVTLEPCNHHGKTPPCTQLILESGFQRVVIGAQDPNPRVQGGGGDFLKKAGTHVVQGVLKKECEELIRAFSKWVTTGMPWITVKTAWTLNGSMLPPPGQKTFTSDASLKLAHVLRKRADAILTGSGTVLADQPQFTVRLVPDHLEKKRWLVVLDRRRRVPESWVKSAELKGFEVRSDLALSEALVFLGSRGCLEVLVEAGPALSAEILGKNLWDEHVMIRQQELGRPDEVVIKKKVQ